jgi:ubiquinone/menaquinone biosynthesis C-methylase UbiE
MTVQAASEAESFWVQRLTSGAGFCCMLGSGSGQVLEGFWRDVFSTARPGSRLLEIGCGSGDVSIWAAEAGRQLRIVASDIHDHAEIVRQHPDVSFLGHARAEALPVEAASFDMIVSNFAFEYTGDRAAAAAELARVLRPGGGGAMVVHSTDSAVTESSRALLEAHERLVAADIPGRVRRSAALRSDHLSRRKMLKDVLRMQEAFAAPRHALTAAFFDIAERLLKQDPTARAELERVDGMAARLVDMSKTQIGAALDSAALSGLEAQFLTQGLQAHTSEITGAYDNSLVQKVGWLVFLTKKI